MNAWGLASRYFQFREISQFLSVIPSEYFPIIAVLIVACLGLILWLIWSQPSPTLPQKAEALQSLPTGYSAIARPLLSQAEASIFNMVRLAVQDSYLVFAKIPLTTLIRIHKTQDTTQQAMLKSIRHIRLDLLLIHPGTLELAKVIYMKGKDGSHAQSPHKQRLVNAVLESASIETVELSSTTRYSVAELVTLLGLGEEE